MGHEIENPLSVLWLGENSREMHSASSGGLQKVKHETQLKQLQKPQTFGLSLFVSLPKKLLISLADLQQPCIILPDF